MILPKSNLRIITFTTRMADSDGEPIPGTERERNLIFNSYYKQIKVKSGIEAMPEIALEKGLDAIIDSRSVFSGGVDITDVLIQQLNRN